MDLDTAYERYKTGRGFGRSDLFRMIIDELKELRARIGSVDEEAVAAIDQRVSGLETVIGRALQVEQPPRRGPGRPRKEEGMMEAANG